MGKNERLRKVFEVLNELSEQDKYWFMGYLSIDADLKKLNEKIERFLAS